MGIAAIADFDRARTHADDVRLAGVARGVDRALRSCCAPPMPVRSADAPARARSARRGRAAADRARAFRVCADRPGGVGSQRVGRPVDARAHRVGGVRGGAARERPACGSSPAGATIRAGRSRCTAMRMPSVRARRSPRCSRVWFFAVNVLSPGDVSPLPYLPLANPLDLTLALALAAVFGWGAALRAAFGAGAVRMVRRRAVRRAQRRRAAHRASLGRHPVAAAGAPRIETAAGRADADLERDRAGGDVHRDAARAAAAVDGRRRDCWRSSSASCS